MDLNPNQKWSNSPKPPTWSGLKWRTEHKYPIMATSVSDCDSFGLMRPKPTVELSSHTNNETLKKTAGEDLNCRTTELLDLWDNPRGLGGKSLLNISTTHHQVNQWNCKQEMKHQSEFLQNKKDTKPEI